MTKWSQSTSVLQLAHDSLRITENEFSVSIFSSVSASYTTEHSQCSLSFLVAMKKFQTGIIGLVSLQFLVLCSNATSLTSSSPLVSLATTLIQRYMVPQVASSEISSDTAGNKPETRGGHGHGHGWGHGGYGHGHGHGHGHGYGAITLDPVSIISLLALGAFLINNILQLLQANANGRMLSGSYVRSRDPPLYNSTMQYDDGSDDPNFGEFFERVGSLYYLQPLKRHICLKKVVCTYLDEQKSREEYPKDFKSTLFDFMLSTVARFVAPELTPHSPVKEKSCHKFKKMCTDNVLQNAKLSVKKKVLSEVTSLVSSITIKNLMTF